MLPLLMPVVLTPRHACHTQSWLREPYPMGCIFARTRLKFRSPERAIVDSFGSI
jgi:hypothetical protein